MIDRLRVERDVCADDGGFSQMQDVWVRIFLSGVIQTNRRYEESGDFTARL
jgi:hypothetical protein